MASHSTKQCSYYLKPSKSTVVKLGGPEGGAGRGSVDRAAMPAIGLVVMTKKPVDFEHWLAYHLHVVGVRRFFVQVEDTPELAAILVQPPWNEFVDATFVSKTDRDYFVQMDRQTVHIASSMPRCKLAELDWLIHIDDDELLYCPNGVDKFWAALQAAPTHVADVHLQNLEAVAPENCAHPFSTCTTFISATSKFTSYTNGKSVGRVAAPGLRAHGPHHFRADALGNGQTLNVPPPTAVVLHYESCTFEKWAEKFAALARKHGADPKIVAKLPFPFYRESLAAMLRVQNAASQSEKGAALHDATELWHSKKSETKCKLRPPETLHVIAVRDALASLFPPQNTTSTKFIGKKDPNFAKQHNGEASSNNKSHNKTGRQKDPPPPASASTNGATTNQNAPYTDAPATAANVTLPLKRVAEAQVPAASDLPSLPALKTHATAAPNATLLRAKQPQQ